MAMGMGAVSAGGTQTQTQLVASMGAHIVPDGNGGWTMHNQYPAPGSGNAPPPLYQFDPASGQMMQVNAAPPPLYQFDPATGQMIQVNGQMLSGAAGSAVPIQNDGKGAPGGGSANPSRYQSATASNQKMTVPPELSVTSTG